MGVNIGDASTRTGDGEFVSFICTSRVVVVSGVWPRCVLGTDIDIGVLTRLIADQVIDATPSSSGDETPTLARYLPIGYCGRLATWTMF